MNSQEIDITMATEKDIREMIDLLEEAGKGLDEATKNLKDAYKCMLVMFKENDELKKNLDIAKFLIASLTDENERLEKENNTMKEFMVNA